MFLSSGCAKDTDSLNPSRVKIQEDQSKSAESLISSISKSAEMQSIVINYSIILSEARLKENFSDYLDLDASTIQSEEEILSYYGRIFLDASQMYSRVSLLQESYEGLYSNFSSLGDYSQETQGEIIVSAYIQALDDLDIQPAANCDGCEVGVAIGAVFCLPSLGAAGFGYMICAVGVLASAIHCCYG